MSDFYTALTPCHKLQLWLGLADFTVEGPVNHRTLKIIQIKSWYKLTFIVLTLTVTAVFVLLNDVIAPIKSESEFHWFVALYDLHSDYLFMLGLLASSLLFRNELIRSWQGVMAADTLLGTFKPNTNDALVQRLNHTFLLFGFVCNTLVHFNTDNIVSHQEIKFFWVSNLLYWILNFHRICTECTFQAWTLSLKHRFQALHEWVHDNEVLVTQAELLQIQRLHQLLCEISGSVSKVYAVPNLFNMSINIFIFIFQTYDFVILPSMHWRQMLKRMVYLTWTGFDIVAVVVSCALAANHERMLRRRLFGLLNTRMCLRREVNSLSVQMLHFNGEFTAAGYVVMDATLLFQIAGAIAAYLLIFLQFYYLNN